MSSKINITNIISGHLSTLIDGSTDQISKVDIFTFFLFPLICAISSVVLGFKFTDDFISLLVNFGAIFTALLLSVLVLVYDQSTKLKDKGENNTDITFNIKKGLLKHLYYNICYSIIVSVTLVTSCFIEAITRPDSKIPLSLEIQKFQFSDCFNAVIATPLIVFLTIHLILTILMIVKRMHTLLISDGI